MDTENQKKAVGPAAKVTEFPQNDPIHDYPDPAISGESVDPDWIPEGPEFPTDLKQIHEEFGTMTDAKKALMADVKALIYSRTKSPELSIEIAFLLMGSTVKLVETGNRFSPEHFLDLLIGNANMWQSLLVRRVQNDLRDLATKVNDKEAELEASARLWDQAAKDARIEELMKALGDKEEQIERLKGRSTASGSGA